MAFSHKIKLWISAAPLFCLAISWSLLGAAAVYYDVPEAESAGAWYNATSSKGVDPTQIAAKALLCFDDKYVYESCEQSYRLTAAGELDIPHNSTDEFCTGPCLSETNLVLNCIDNITMNFEFYNKATIQDIRDTVKAGCGHGPERGNFNVTKYVEAEEGSASDAAAWIRFQLGLGLLTLGSALLL